MSEQRHLPGYNDWLREWNESSDSDWDSDVSSASENATVLKIQSNSSSIVPAQNADSNLVPDAQENEQESSIPLSEQIPQWGNHTSTKGSREDDVLLSLLHSLLSTPDVQSYDATWDGSSRQGKSLRVKEFLQKLLLDPLRRGILAIESTQARYFHDYCPIAVSFCTTIVNSILKALFPAEACVRTIHPNNVLEIEGTTVHGSIQQVISKDSEGNVVSGIFQCAYFLRALEELGFPLAFSASNTSTSHAPSSDSKHPELYEEWKLIARWLISFAVLAVDNCFSSPHFQPLTADTAVTSPFLAPMSVAQSSMRLRHHIRWLIDRTKHGSAGSLYTPPFLPPTQSYSVYDPSSSRNQSATRNATISHAKSRFQKYLPSQFSSSKASTVGTTTQFTSNTATATDTPSSSASTPSLSTPFRSPFDVRDYSIFASMYSLHPLLYLFSSHQPPHWQVPAPSFPIYHSIPAALVRSVEKALESLDERVYALYQYLQAYRIRYGDKETALLPTKRSLHESLAEMVSDPMADDQSSFCEGQQLSVIRFRDEMHDSTGTMEKSLDGDTSHTDYRLSIYDVHRWITAYEQRLQVLEFVLLQSLYPSLRHGFFSEMESAHSNGHLKSHLEREERSSTAALSSTMNASYMEGYLKSLPVPLHASATAALRNISASTATRVHDKSTKDSLSTSRNTVAAQVVQSIGLYSARAPLIHATSTFDAVSNMADMALALEPLSDDDIGSDIGNAVPNPTTAGSIPQPAFAYTAYASSPYVLPYTEYPPLPSLLSLHQTLFQDVYAAQVLLMQQYLYPPCLRLHPDTPDAMVPYAPPPCAFCDAQFASPSSPTTIIGDRSAPTRLHGEQLPRTTSSIIPSAICHVVWELPYAPEGLLSRIAVASDVWATLLLNCTRSSTPRTFRATQKLSTPGYPLPYSNANRPQHQQAAASNPYQLDYRGGEAQTLLSTLYGRQHALRDATAYGFHHLSNLLFHGVLPLTALPRTPVTHALWTHDRDGIAPVPLLATLRDTWHAFLPIFRAQKRGEHTTNAGTSASLAITETKDALLASSPEQYLSHSRCLQWTSAFGVFRVQQSLVSAFLQRWRTLLQKAAYGFSPEATLDELNKSSKLGRGADVAPEGNCNELEEMIPMKDENKSTTSDLLALEDVPPGIEGTFPPSNRPVLVDVARPSSDLVSVSRTKSIQPATSTFRVSQDVWNLIHPWMTLTSVSLPTNLHEHPIAHQAHQNTPLYRVLGPVPGQEVEFSEFEWEQIAPLLAVAGVQPAGRSNVLCSLLQTESGSHASVQSNGEFWSTQRTKDAMVVASPTDPKPTWSEVAESREAAHEISPAATSQRHHNLVPTTLGGESIVSLASRTIFPLLLRENDLFSSLSSVYLLHSEGARLTNYLQALQTLCLTPLGQLMHPFATTLSEVLWFRDMIPTTQTFLSTIQTARVPLTVLLPDFVEYATAAAATSMPSKTYPHARLGVHIGRTSPSTLSTSLLAAHPLLSAPAADTISTSFSMHSASIASLHPMLQDLLHSTNHVAAAIPLGTNTETTAHNASADNKFLQMLPLSKWLRASIDASREGSWQSKRHRKRHHQREHDREFEYPDASLLLPPSLSISLGPAKKATDTPTGTSNVATIGTSGTVSSTRWSLEAFHNPYTTIQPEACVISVRRPTPATSTTDPANTPSFFAEFDSLELTYLPYPSPFPSFIPLAALADAHNRCFQRSLALSAPLCPIGHLSHLLKTFASIHLAMQTRVRRFVPDTCPNSLFEFLRLQQHRIRNAGAVLHTCRSIVSSVTDHIHDTGREHLNNVLKNLLSLLPTMFLHLQRFSNPNDKGQEGLHADAYENVEVSTSGTFSHASFSNFAFSRESPIEVVQNILDDYIANLRTSSFSDITNTTVFRSVMEVYEAIHELLTTLYFYLSIHTQTLEDLNVVLTRLVPPVEAGLNHRTTLAPLSPLASRAISAILRGYSPILESSHNDLVFQYRHLRLLVQQKLGRLQHTLTELHQRDDAPSLVSLEGEQVVYGALLSSLENGVALMQSISEKVKG